MFHRKQHEGEDSGNGFLPFVYHHPTLSHTAAQDSEHHFIADGFDGARSVSSTNLRAAGDNRA